MTTNITTLHIAVRNQKNIKIVEQLLIDGADVNQLDPSPRYNIILTPLQIALEKNKNEEIIKILIDYGADVNIQDDCENTSLHRAVVFDHSIETISLIINSCSNINSQNDDGKTPLYYAIETNNKKIIKLLIDHGADVNINPYNDTTLNAAIVHMCDQDIIDLFITHGYKLSPNDSLLRCAIYFDNDDIIDLLINNGADVNQQDAYGQTPLHQAILYNKNYKVIVILINHGANPNIKNNKGDTPISLALKRKVETDIIELFNQYLEKLFYYTCRYMKSHKIADNVLLLIGKFILNTYTDEYIINIINQSNN